jgi:hypothetical protein
LRSLSGLSCWANEGLGASAAAQKRTTNAGAARRLMNRFQHPKL